MFSLPQKKVMFSGGKACEMTGKSRPSGLEELDDEVFKTESWMSCRLRFKNKVSCAGNVFFQLKVEYLHIYIYIQYIIHVYINIYYI